VRVDHILSFSCKFINPLASAVLISSNPTNLVFSGAFSLSFVTYTSSVALPFLAAALAVYIYLSMVLFRSVEYIPPSIELSGGGVGGDGLGIDRPSTALIDKAGAIFGSILLMMTLGALTGTTTIGVPVWQVAVPAAAMMLSRDLWRDWRCHRAHQALAKEQGVEQLTVPPTVHPEIELQDLPFSASRSNSRSPVCHSTRQWVLSTVLSTWAHSLVQTFPTVHAVHRQLPLSLVPFAFLIFILVQGLASQGWVHVFARWWGAWVDKTGVVGAVGGMMIGSGLLCNVCPSVRCRVQSSRHFRYVARISARPFF
jgi:Na+/H+ antiporter NhaD/arsenite permease-like protein